MPGYVGLTVALDPCNGSEEQFTSRTISLDNDGDLLYDGDDPNCQAVGVPTISVAPPSKDYGDVTVMSSSSQVFTISNGGGADLVLSDGVLSDMTNFSLSLNGGTNPCGDVEPLTIGALDNCTVSVAFIPQDVGTFPATITITSNDTTNSPLIVDLTGNGVLGPAPNLAVTPAIVDFGEVNVGDTPAVEVTLSNTGTDNLVVSGIALDNAAVYSLDETGGLNPCGSLTPTIVAGDNCTVDVIFAPAEDGGPFNATVTIDSNTPSVDVPVTGTGFLDTDGDGVGDSVDDFPNDASKATPLAATGTGKITVDAGTNALSMVAAVAEGDVDPTGKPSGFTFPDGLVTFKVAVPGNGDNAVVTITFPSGQPVGSQYFKVNAGGFFEFAGATINTDNVVLLLTDGGSGDIDNTADAMITDPGGLAVPVPVSSSSGGSSGCSFIGSGGNGGGGAVLFLTLLAILVTLRRQRAKARR
ncbi:MAG: choice-of-anchor D domain-containing protein [Candidatus Deferrimicrobiaceae bacterium]